MGWMCGEYENFNLSTVCRELSKSGKTIFFPPKGSVDDWESFGKKIERDSATTRPWLFRCDFPQRHSGL